MSTPASSANLGALVKRYRVAAGLSQEALAARAQLSARAVSDLERGLRRAPRLSTIEMLAEALALAPHQCALLLAAARPEVAGIADGADPADSTPLIELPIPPTALVGRADDLAQVRALLTTGHGRLLTVVGPGGVGKTHFCLALARDLAPAFADGTVFVSLAPIRDAALVPGAVAQALHLREAGGVLAAEAVRDALRTRHMLLVLDNCEQVLGAAEFVAELLATCPRLVVLASSRMSLRVRAEQQYPLAPLPLADAIALFRERARMVAPRAALAEPDVAALCRRLDCLPLALELAAAHANTLAPARILDQLNQGLGMPGDGPRDLPTRQQTLRDAIGWSYDLLTPEQQGCLWAVAVFTGGWTLEAALAVCWDSGTVEHSTGVLTLAALVDANLVRVERAAGEARFSLLELTRDYVLARPHEDGERERIAERHARYYVGLAPSLQALAAHENAVFARYLADLPNAIAALEWAVARRDAPLAMELLDVVHLWHVSGQVTPAVYWLDRVLALDAAARAHGAPAASLPLRVRRLYGLARTLTNGGQMERAEAVANEAVHVAGEIGDDDGLSNALATRGQIALATGRPDTAERDLEASYAAAEASGDPELLGQALFFRAQSARVRGELERAVTLLEEAIAIATAEENVWGRAVMTTLLGQVHHQRGQFAAALARYREALPLFGAFHSPNFTAWCLEGCAATLGAEGEHARATRLLAAAAALRHEARLPLPPAERTVVERICAAARAALGETAWAEAHAAGVVLTLEAAIADAVVDATTAPSG